MDYQALVAKQRTFFNNNQTKTYEYRLNALIKLEQAIIKYEQELYLALKKDLHKSEMESYATDIGYVLMSINESKKNLKKWMKDKKIKNPIYLLDSKSFIHSEPYGVCLIISPFNYPVQLTLVPLIGAIIAGNTAIIKTSKASYHVSLLIYKMINETFSEEYIHVIPMENQDVESLLKIRYDYIFFTGSVKVGKIVLEAASKHLTPTTLELGGKNPLIINDTHNINEVAQKVAWAKFLNVGQTCIAPDYLLIEASLKDQFIEAIKRAIVDFYSKDIYHNEDYGRIISLDQTKRLTNLLKTTKGNIVSGGEIVLEDKYISPTIVDNISWNDPLMAEEIFGPILPIITYQKDKLDEMVINPIKSREKPLSLYLFTNDNLVENRIVNELSYGGGVINDLIIHLTNGNLPFGGVGNSGMNNYHGQYSFDNFSHQKSILKKGKLIKLNIMYPPFSKKKLNIIKKLLK